MPHRVFCPPPAFLGLRTRRFLGCYLRCHLGCWTLVILLLPALLPACVCCGRVTVAAVVIVTCLMLPVFRCVACAGRFALGALLVVTCDVTWAAEPLSLLLFLRCYLRVCALGVLPSWVWWW